MSVKIMYGALVLIFIFVVSVNAGCVCHEKGVDYCEKCKAPTFVRPQPRYAYKNPAFDLTPIGGTCSCNKVFVEPAALPKPCGKKPPPPPKYPPCKCRSSQPPSYYSPSPPTPKYSPGSDYYKPAPLPPAPPKPCGCAYAPAVPAYPLPDLTYAKPKSNSIPADPISISLALQASKATAVPEAKLAYGFAKTPIDSLKKIALSKVPEEHLFQLKSEVITLKKPSAAASPSSEEEEEPEEEEAVESPDESPTLTYNQLGYVPEKFKNPKFRKISSSYSADYYSNEAQPIPDKVRVDCGFRPGRIAEYIKRKNNKHPADNY
ncbi:uncharacterized protein LOC129237851 [Anastrepha obliqua]|uniref:uncharacterized protein LOC129237851 n=1 Tax=Anastrepha obliqua TaxID=95512 RepID=UPI0024094F3F|nr:uncharacterized protein LOC129237851 [Anastrepha obliqua]